MKKKISLVNLDSSLVRWLYEKFRQSAPDAQGKKDFMEALEELIQGSIGLIMLEMEGESVSPIENDIVQSGALMIDAKSRKVIRGGIEITLTPKEFDILYFLARNRGEIFTKEQIYQAVWEDDYLLDDSNIMAFIRKIRKKIEPHPDAPEYILTIWGIGYKFNDKIE